jgi:hypothetical protein
MCLYPRLVYTNLKVKICGSVVNTCRFYWRYYMALLAASEEH